MRELFVTLLLMGLMIPCKACDNGEEDLSKKMHVFESCKPGEIVEEDKVVHLSSWKGELKDHPTKNNFGTSSLHGDIQPQFVEALFHEPGQEVLEVGPADGLMLEVILKDPRNLTIPIRYTVVEPSAEHLSAIDGVIKKHNKNKENWFGKAKKGDIREFIKDENKSKKYKYILCSQVLHYMDPKDQLDVLNGFHRLLQDDGKLYLITNSYLSVDLWILSDGDEEEKKQLADSYIKRIVDLQSQDDLWPGYGFNTTFSSSWIYAKNVEKLPHDVPTLHTPTSLKNLLNAVGFSAELWRNFAEKDTSLSGSLFKEYCFMSSPRLGVIASKGVPDAKKLVDYEISASKKVEDKNHLKQYIEENLELLLTLGKLFSS